MTDSNFETRCIDAARAQTPEAGLSWLQPVREAALQAFAKVGVPQRKTENWRYTPVYPLTQGDFLRPATSTAGAGDFAIADLDSYRLVFSNGRFNAQRSDLSDLPFELVPFASATAEQQQRISAKLGTVLQAEQHPFALLNLGWLQDGAYVRVAANVQLDKPIQLVFEQTPEAQSFSAQARVFVELDANSQAVLLEQHVGGSSPDSSAEIFSNTVLEIALAEGARLCHYQLNLEAEPVLHIGNVQVALNANADYESHQLALAGKLKRRDLQVNFRQPGSNARLFGVYLGRRSQHVDFHTVLEHIAPHCTSNEVVKGIVKDEARAVFNGRIHIHRDAQQTSAEMSNKNLLLSKTAEVNTKPELEIYADDVKCSHGATVGQLDEGALFYFRSRGIAADQAYEMLSNAFIAEVLEQMPNEAIRAYAATWVARFHQATGG